MARSNWSRNLLNGVFFTIYLKKVLCFLPKFVKFVDKRRDQQKTLFADYQMTVSSIWLQLLLCNILIFNSKSFFIIRCKQSQSFV